MIIGIGFIAFHGNFARLVVPSLYDWGKLKKSCEGPRTKSRRWASRNASSVADIHRVRPKGSASTLEARRRLAAKLLAQGHGIREVARRIGASPSSVKRWKDSLENGGKQALKAKPHAGRPARLSPQQREDLVRILLAGASAAGFPSGNWTCSRVGQVIWKRFGVRYHPDHISRILRTLGWRYQESAQNRKRGFVPPSKRRWLAG